MTNLEHLQRIVPPQHFPLGQHLILDILDH